MTEGAKITPEQLKTILISNSEKWVSSQYPLDALAKVNEWFVNPDFEKLADAINRQHEENQIDDFERSH